MAIKGFGINVDANRIDGDLDLLRQDLSCYKDAGFDCVEIPVHGVGAVCNGSLMIQQVQAASSILKEFPFRYIVHAPDSLNLMDLRGLNVQKKLLLSSIQFAYTIGSETLVCHCGRYTPEEEFSLNWRHEDVSFEMMEKMKQIEVEALRDVADYARDLGIEICLENARPYLDGSPYCYGEFLDQLAAQVQLIGKENVGITLDLGHAYLAAKFYGFDFLEAVGATAPLVKHIHVHDNFGKPSASYETDQAELVAVGKGDCHMPIGWGHIPIAEALSVLQEYQGVFMQELRPRYMRYCRLAFDQAREMADQAGWLEDSRESLATA